MYGRAGLPPAERELGAIGSSIVNRCVYCAAVHGARYNQLTKTTELVAKIFADETEAQLDERSQALFDFSVELAKSPPALKVQHADGLKELGFDTLGVVDLVLATAIFGWANRLMHVLVAPPHNAPFPSVPFSASNPLLTFRSEIDAFGEAMEYPYQTCYTICRNN
ncbi:Carboxymuconolactone decarboxylase family protein [compost metagenome]